MKNTGRPYEALVEQLFSQILQQQQVNSLETARNKTVPGKSTGHEIDIFWSFEYADIKYQTLIQAKDWKNRVPKGELLKFKAILEDVPGQPRGIFVTRTGYQKGAIEVAKTNGILLYEFREPTETDTRNWLRSVHVSGRLFVPQTKYSLEYDDEWIRAQMHILGLKDFGIEFREIEDKFYLYNSDGTIFKSIHQVSQEKIAELNGLV